MISSIQNFNGMVSLLNPKVIKSYPMAKIGVMGISKFFEGGHIDDDDVKAVVEDMKKRVINILS